MNPEAPSRVHTRLRNFLSVHFGLRKVTTPTPTPMNPFDQLPSELLLQVIKHISIPSAVCLTLCSRSLYNRLLPITLSTLHKLKTPPPHHPMHTTLKPCVCGRHHPSRIPRFPNSPATPGDYADLLALDLKQTDADRTPFFEIPFFTGNLQWMRFLQLLQRDLPLYGPCTRCKKLHAPPKGQVTLARPRPSEVAAATYALEARAECIDRCERRRERLEFD